MAVFTRENLHLPAADAGPLLPAGARASALLWQGAAAGAGLVLGAGQVYGGAAPFGLALVIGCPPGYLFAAGAGALAPEVTERVFSALQSPARSPRGGRGRQPAARDRSINGISLTRREWQVLGEIGAGHPNAVISERLGIRQGTVKSHITRLLAKLGVRSRLQAALLAREAGVPNAGPADRSE